MKKRFFAALAASMLLGGVMTAPAAAADYKKGDVNMDGEVSFDDAQLALIDYIEYVVAGKTHSLSDEQQELANVDGVADTWNDRSLGERESKVSIVDAVYLLQYATECTADSQLKDKDIQTWIDEFIIRNK